ncbi:hypothetical protein ACWEG1_06240 [Streptomyces bauhiniae]
MTPRRLRVLIQRLPPESATWTAIRNAMSDEELAAQSEKGEPEKGRWSQQEQLLAALVDATRRVEYVLICANTDKKAQRPRAPEPVPRPGSKAARPKPVMTDEQANHLFNLMNAPV